MRLSAWIMGLTAALAIGFAWPAVGAAQNTKAKAAATQQQDAPRKAKARANRTVAAKPCAARNWTGCRGWDPDPNVRSEIQRDAGRDDL